jgi:hypothetical protein
MRWGGRSGAARTARRPFQQEKTWCERSVMICTFEPKEWAYLERKEAVESGAVGRVLGEQAAHGVKGAIVKVAARLDVVESSAVR